MDRPDTDRYHAVCGTGWPTREPGGVEVGSSDAGSSDADAEQNEIDAEPGEAPEEVLEELS